MPAASTAAVTAAAAGLGAVAAYGLYRQHQVERERRQADEETAKLRRDFEERTAQKREEEDIEAENKTNDGYALVRMKEDILLLKLLGAVVQATPRERRPESGSIELPLMRSAGSPDSPAAIILAVGLTLGIKPDLVFTAMQDQECRLQLGLAAETVSPATLRSIVGALRSPDLEIPHQDLAALFRQGVRVVSTLLGLTIDRTPETRAKFVLVKVYSSDFCALYDVSKRLDLQIMPWGWIKRDPGERWVRCVPRKDAKSRLWNPQPSDWMGGQIEIVIANFSLRGGFCLEIDNVRGSKVSYKLTEPQPLLRKYYSSMYSIIVLQYYSIIIALALL